MDYTFTNDEFIQVYKRYIATKLTRTVVRCNGKEEEVALNDYELLVRAQQWYRGFKKRPLRDNAPQAKRWNEIRKRRIY